METSKRKVLCVDDDEDTCEMLSVVWRNSDYQLTLAHTVAEALTRALTDEFDLILLDSHLPDASGIDLCRQIREADQQTPIIFYSADAYPKHINEALEAGANLYLTKPLSPDGVGKAIDQLLGESDSRPASRP
jgi:DNA-binding response OmpR family regulator